MSIRQQFKRLLPLIIACVATAGMSSLLEHDRFRPDFTLDQITQVQTIGQWDLSPDGTRVVYALRGFFYGFPVVPRFGRDNNLFMVDVRNGEIRKLTSGTFPKSNPRFSPDGDRIAYEADGDIWVVEVGTGDARRMTVSPADDRDPAWSPDGESIVFVSNRSSRYGELGGQTDLWITSSLRLQEHGTRVGLRRLTDDRASEREPRWSPDGDSIVFTERRSGDHFYGSGIALVSAAGGPKRRLTPADDYAHFRPRFSPDGSRLAFLSDRSGYVHVWTMDSGGGTLREFDTGPYDSHSPHFIVQPIWSRDSGRILVGVNRGGRFDLETLNVHSGQARTVASTAEAGGGQFHEIGWGPDGELVYAWENAWSPPDLYLGTPGLPHPQARQLTFSSHAAFRKEHFASVERVSLTSSDGLELGGFLLTPRGLQSGDRLPAIVNIHTNTYGQFYDHWTPFFHYLVESGYPMLMVDQRGSAGYGRHFRAAIAGAFDREVLEDIRTMAAFLKSKQYVDPNRVAAMGLSHGGYRTLFALVRDPELFSAGIDLMGPADRRTPYLNSNGAFHIGAAEAEAPELYERLSPVTMIDRLQAPLLVMHSNEDRNVPGAMTYNLVDELDRHHKDYDVVYYPGEAHGLADPAHQFDAYRRIVEFLERELGTPANP